MFSAWTFIGFEGWYSIRKTKVLLLGLFCIKNKWCRKNKFIVCCYFLDKFLTASWLIVLTLDVVSLPNKKLYEAIVLYLLYLSNIKMMTLNEQWFLRVANRIKDILMYVKYICLVYYGLPLFHVAAKEHIKVYFESGTSHFLKKTI